MAGILKVLFDNLLQGPSTDPYPLGETFTPKKVRARCIVDPDLCVGCGMCRYACAAGAINIDKKPDGSGFTITIWRNSCCLCAACRHYCPTGAMSLNNDWHLAHPESEKYALLEQHTIDYVPCIECGTLIRPLPLKLAEKIYAHDPNIEADHVRRLCPKCRQMEDARRNERVYPQVVENPGDMPAVEGAKDGEQIVMTKEPEKTREMAQDVKEVKDVKEAPDAKAAKDENNASNHGDAGQENRKRSDDQ